ncbi:MAG: T9SS type A sorting domain-containing protein [Chitinophagaceae bacterium]|nr:T9SS type A sorting domain-containing protein [Chitinophagaceae bacterium]
MKHTFLKLLAVLLFFHHTGVAQLSVADSNYLNSIYNEMPYVSYWDYPGIWYHHTEPTSIQNFYDQIDSSFKFHNDEFADCYHKMYVSNILERDTAINATIHNYEVANNIKVYGNKDPFVKVAFSLNNKSTYCYAVLDSMSAPVYNTDYAFVIISGTGTNLLKEIIDGTGYHDLNCYVRNLLKPTGDIYVASMPNEDHRAMIFNRKKATSLPSYQPSFLTNYLNAQNKALGLNRLIETVALVKYLKTKYKKVFLLGLSTGGTVALWTSLLAEPDAAIVASGYSVLVDNDFNSQMVNLMSYGNNLLVYDKDSVRNRLSQLHTQFLLTQAMNDSPLVQNDIDSGLTRNFLGATGNVSFFYDYYNHSFPPCSTIDTFFQRCMNMPIARLSEDSSLCNTDSTILKVNLLGKAPFTFDLYRNNLLSTSYTIQSNYCHIPLYQDGNYFIKNIKDSLNNLGYTSDTFHYIKTTKPEAHISWNDYDCSVNKNSMKFEFTGTSPFTVYFTHDNIPDSLHFYKYKDSLLFSNGNYNFTRIKDAKNCSVSAAGSFVLENLPVSCQLNSIDYDCMQGKNDVYISVHGKLPVTLTLYDKILNTFHFEIITSKDFHFKLDSGIYNFMYTQDANDCVFNIDSNVVINNEYHLNQSLYVENFLLKATNVSFPAYYWFLNDLPYNVTTEPYLNIATDGKYQLGNYNDFNCFERTANLDVSLGKIHIYPNPVSNAINIFLALEKGETVSASITDIAGQVIAKRKMKEGLNQWMLSDLPRGMYLLNFETNLMYIHYNTQKLFKN